MTILEPITRSTNGFLAYTSLRMTSKKFALGFKVTYQEPLGVPSSEGSWPPTPTYEPVGLRLVAWELHLRGLRMMLGK